MINHWIKRLVVLGIISSFLVGCAGGAGSGALPTIPDTPVPQASLAPRQSNQPPSTTASLPGGSTSTPSQLSSTQPPTLSNSSAHIKTVFIILMENHNWSDIFNSPFAPYINKTLLPQASYAQQYYNPPGIHPSNPNYLWLESGASFGITSDGTPSEFHQSTKDHLVTYLNNAGISWKAYEEGISGKECPLRSNGLYVPKHNPMIFFDDVTGNNNPNDAYCIAHERPYSELQTDLQNNTAAQYNFITPNLCNDMHDASGCATSDAVKNGDTWLSEQVPMIMASTAYKQGGVIFITWDESENGDHPIGMIVLSPFAKGGGYTNEIQYTHSSTLRTIQEIFNVKPWLGDAANATDLRDLFKVFP